MVPRGNPRGLARVADLATGELRFVNRQPGSGTRVWLEAQLQRQGLHLKQLPRLPREALTHLEAARRVAEGQGDVAVGVEAAARVAGLDFVPLARERYDLVIPYFVWQRFALERVQVWLGEEEARSAIEALEGYETAGSGRVRWVGELPHKMKTRFEGEGTDADTPRAARRRDPSTD
jgi:putative molybdopterin biosynthesis protein